MSNHPNRSSRDNPAANPRPADIRAARESLSLTQTAAAAVIGYTRDGWAKFEGGERRMPPVIWRAWRHLAGIERMPFPGE